MALHFLARFVDILFKYSIIISTTATVILPNKYLNIYIYYNIIIYNNIYILYSAIRIGPLPIQIGIILRGVLL